MLSSIKSHDPLIINRNDSAAILRVLADMLPIHGVILDEDGNAFPTNPDHRYDCCSHPEYLRAHIKILQINKVLVKLQSLQSSTETSAGRACCSLFILAKCDGEWEIIGQPLPRNLLSISA